MPAIPDFTGHPRYIPGTRRPERRRADRIITLDRRQGPEWVRRGIPVRDDTGLLHTTDEALNA